MSRYEFDDVSIHGFRGLRHLRLESLGRINLLVGENNCGKTSVLEAMSVLCDPFNPHEWLSMVDRRDFGGLDESRLHSLRWCFEQHGELAQAEITFEGQCEMECTGSFPLRRLVTHYKDLSGEPDSTFFDRLSKVEMMNARLSRLRMKSESWTGAELKNEIQLAAVVGSPDHSKESTETTVAIEVWNELSPSRHIQKDRRRVVAETLTPYSYQSNRKQVRHLSSQLVKAEKQGFSLELLQSFDSEILGIQVASLLGKRPAIYLRHRRLGPAPLSIFGDALRRAVLLASVLPSVGGGVLSIDEIETGIHVSALERVFAWLIPLARELDVQVIATTHSLEAVDAVMASMGDNVDDLVTYHLEQRENETNAKRIAGDVLHRLRFDRGLDVR